MPGIKTKEFIEIETETGQAGPRNNKECAVEARTEIFAVKMSAGKAGGNAPEVLQAGGGDDPKAGVQTDTRTDTAQDLGHRHAI